VVWAVPVSESAWADAVLGGLDQRLADAVDIDELGSLARRCDERESSALTLKQARMYV
jgi:hypothetical protein